MERVWDKFIEEYGEYLDNYPLVIILEAFWNYSYDKGNKKRCDKVFVRYMQER